MKKFFLKILIVICVPVVAHCQSDFSELLEQYKSQLSVVYYEPDQNEYQVRVYPESYFTQKLGTAEFDAKKLENKYFKVVEGFKDEALPLSDLDGRNVFFHLNRAREYFYAIDPENPALNQKITVRVRVAQDYNVVTHYTDHAWFNDSRFVPANYRGKWQSEMWFHARKVKYDYLKPLGDSISIAKFSATPLLGAFAYPILLDLYKDGGMDGAKIPSVIYHEAFHWATNHPSLLPTEPWSHPVSEDFANYFAISLSGQPSTGEMGEFSSRSRIRHYDRLRQVPLRRAKKVKYYNDFTLMPALMWQIRLAMGQEKADQLVWRVVKASKKSMEPQDLFEILKNELRNDPAISDAQRIKLLDTFEKFEPSVKIINAKFYQRKEQSQ